jgi:hypothetical protein
MVRKIILKFLSCRLVLALDRAHGTELHGEDQYNDLSLMNLVEFVSTE